MRRKELVAAVAARSEITKVDAAMVIKNTLAVINEALAREEQVQLMGFGTFCIKEYAARTGVNPQTKQPMEISATKRIGFRPSKAKK